MSRFVLPERSSPYILHPNIETPFTKVDNTVYAAGRSECTEPAIRCKQQALFGPAVRNSLSRKSLSFK